MGHLDDVKPDLENETRRKSENLYSGVSFENINIRHPRAQLTPYTPNCASWGSSRWSWVCSAQMENANSKGTVESGIWQWGRWGFKFGGGVVTTITAWCPSAVVFLWGIFCFWHQQGTVRTGGWRYHRYWSNSAPIFFVHRSLHRRLCVHGQGIPFPAC